jgi:hypothetical protein
MWHPKVRRKLLVELLRPPLRSFPAHLPGNASFFTLKSVLGIGVRSYSCFHATQLRVEKSKSREGFIPHPDGKHVSVVIPKGMVVRAVERLEMVYPASHFAQALKLAKLGPADRRSTRPVTMVLYRLEEGYGDGWVFERHPDGRTVMEVLPNAQVRTVMEVLPNAQVRTVMEVLPNAQVSPSIPVCFGILTYPVNLVFYC